MSEIVAPEPQNIERAARLLHDGRLVAFPTETVYGLGADAGNPEAIMRIFAAKGRPSNHPLIVHVRADADLRRWARDIPDAARQLIARFWPGPLTLILACAPGVSPALTGGQDTIGVRSPAHPVAQALLAAFAAQGGDGIAAPSANRFGHISPTTAQHVADDLGDGVDLILDGGACEIGIESTILDLSRGSPVLLRPGHVSALAIAEAIGVSPTATDASAPRVSGSLEAHYAPRKPLVVEDGPTLMASVQRAINAGEKVAVWARRLELPGPVRNMTFLTQTGDPAKFAAQMYARLRTMDASGADRLFVQAPATTPEWDAINDRLRRAVAGSGAKP